MITILGHRQQGKGTVEREIVGRGRVVRVGMVDFRGGMIIVEGEGEEGGEGEGVVI